MRNIYQLLISLSFVLGISYQISFAQVNLVESKDFKDFEKQVDFLLAGYPFNGNANDISGNGNVGTVNGQSLTADRFNRADRAFQFNSANGGIQTPFVDQPDAISLWFQTVAENSNLMTWGAGTEGVYGYDIKVSSSGVEMVYNSGDGFEDGSTAFLISRTGLLDGNWHQLVIDIDQVSGVFTFYIDNEMIGTQSISANGILWAGINSLGMEIGNFITGRIDDVFFYFGNISASEVNEIYHLSGWAVPDNSLVLNYDFTNAIVEDLSGYGFNSINVVANTAADRFEISSNAISFNGIDQYCETSGIPLYDNISISAWFNTSADYSNGYRSFIDLYGLSALSIGSNNFLEATLRFGESDFPVLSSNLPVNDGLWHHAVLSYDGTTARLYLDNVLVDSRTDFSGPLYRLSLTTFLNLGLIFEPGNNRFYTGEIDDINYYNYGISASEVEALYSENNWPSVSLIASYYFNGNTNDESGNNLNGSSVGSTLTEDRFGAMDSAYNFNGSSYIGISDNSLFSLGQTKDLAVSGWFKTTESSGVLFDKSDGNSGFLAYISDNGSNQLTFFATQDGVGSSQVQSSAGYNDGNWHHFVMQMDRDGGMQIYIDGLLDAENINALSDGFNPDTSEDFLIGVAGGIDNANLNSFFNGSLDDFKIYSNLLTQQEIINLYEDGVWPILGQVQIKINQAEEVHPLDPFYSAFGKEYGNAFEFVDDEIQFILNGRSDRPYGDNNLDSFIDLLGDAVIPANGLNFVKLKDANREYEVAPINSIGFIGSARTGDASGWEGDDWDMEYIGGGVFELNNVVLFDGAWKIRADDNWNYANWGYREGEEGLLSLGTDDIPITAGVYNISVNVIDKTYSVSTVEPSVQPTDFLVNNIGPNSVDFSFTSLEDVSGFLIIRSEAQFPISVPEDFTTYQYGDQINGEIVIYSGPSNSITDNNLNPQTQYFYSIFAYNGSGGSINYLTINPLNGNITTDLLSLASEPSSQPTFFEVVSKSENSAELSFNVSDAPGYLIVRSENSNTFFTPADGITYNVDDIFGDAVISYVGENNTWSESNLSPSANYYFKIYAFNGEGATTNYLQENPLLGEVNTLAEEPTLQATNFSLDEQTASSFTISFDLDLENADGYLVIRADGTFNPSSVPEDGYFYTVGEEFENGDLVVAIGDVSTITETGLERGTSYSYAIFSYKGENDMVNYNINEPLTGTGSNIGVDTSAPIINNVTYDEEIEVGNDVIINCTATDSESGISVVEILYILPNSANFDNATVETMDANGSEYSFTIPNISKEGLEFRIRVTNGVGLQEVSGTRSVGVVFSNGLSIPFNSFGSDQSNYRIISIPLTLDKNSVDDVFTSDLGAYGDKEKWRMFRYTNEATSELQGNTPLIPGRGYWLIVNQSDVNFNTGAGKAVNASTDNPYEIVLSPGWNQIGNPYPYDVSWSDIQKFNGENFELRVFNGTFSNGSTLEAFSGGFVNWPNSSNFTLRIPRTPPSVAQNKNATKEVRGWDINLLLENGSVRNELTGIGMHENALDELDSKDQFNLPRFLNYIDLKHPIVANGYHVAKNIVELQDQYNWTFDIESNLNLRNTIIKWEIPISINFNKDSELFLWDLSSSNLINMKESNQYQLRTSSGKGLKIIYGSMDYVNSLVDLSSFQVNEPFPNPSSGTLTINYFLPENQSNSIISLELFNLKGSLISQKQITNENSGFYSVNWDVNLSAEEKLKGVYLLRLRNGEKNFNKKIIFR